MLSRLGARPPAGRASELAPLLPELGRGPPNAFHGDFLGTSAAHLHVLRALDVAQIAALIDSLGWAGCEGARLAPLLARHTDGNPLYRLETLKLIPAPARRRVRERPGLRRRASLGARPGGTPAARCASSLSLVLPNKFGAHRPML